MRRDVPELMDQVWLPGVARDAITGALRAAEELFRPYDGLLPLIGELLDAAEAPRLVDLCSGAGGPMPSLFARLQAAGRAQALVLTDLRPHAASRAATPPGVQWIGTSVDAAAVDPALRGVRTVFNALHHLPPDVARRVLLDAAAQGQPVLVVETLSWTPMGVIAAVHVALSVAFTWLVPGPRWWARALLTAVPVLPLLLLWEGLASARRCYTEAELREMVQGCTEPYVFEVRRVPAAWVPLLGLTVVSGRPVPRTINA